jgi:hypothetical protein
MPDLLAGSTMRALDTTVTVSNIQGASVTTTSTTYTTSGADCAVVFVAPTTGRVLISINARLANSATNGTLISAQTRTGGTIGGGTVVEDASDAWCVSHYGGTAFERQGITHLLTGLTPGATYNTRLLMRGSVDTATASYANRELIVWPAT